MKCPIGLFSCEGCQYGKENLCDYPYIGDKKVVVDKSEIKHGS
jgi:hypothetical protein